MGLLVNVYRDGTDYDCTRDGVTNRYEVLCVTNVDGPFEPSEEHPAVKLVEGPMRETAIIRPDEGEGKMTMFGGNYVATSDSRFSRAVEKITGSRFYGAVPVHDRIEY